MLLSPYLPLLFMGEEYGESAPFPYFVSHGDEELVAAIRRGRLSEFAAFAHQGSSPDPQAEATFLSAKVNMEQRLRGDHRALFNFYRELIRLRKEWSPLIGHSRENLQIVAYEEERVLAVIRSTGGGRTLCLFNYSDQSRVLRPPFTFGILRVLLDSSGNSPPGSCVAVNATSPDIPTLAPFAVVVYKKE